MENNQRNRGIVAVVIILILMLSISFYLWWLTPEPEETSEFEEKVEKINTKALEWIDTLDVDPVKLRTEMGIKGKKKFVELLQIYLSLDRTTTDSQERLAYKQKVEQLVAVTNTEAYHDMNEINDTQFRQDSTSYLRAWYIMTEFGLNTSYYKSEIDKILLRLDAHLPTRGVNQKMAFVFYYDKLGYAINYTLEELYNDSMIRKRENMSDLDNLEVYFITHEIFSLDENDQMHLITADDMEYIEEVIEYFVNDTITKRNVDLLAELIMIMTILDLDEMDEYRESLELLLESQNANGSFGSYEEHRSYYEELGIDIEIQLYLHTTEVSLKALNEAVNVFD